MSGKRPSRVRAAPARLEDEQAAAFELAELAAAYRNPAASAEVESSSSDKSDDESGPEEEEERKASDVRPPAFPWTTEHAAVAPLAFLPPRGPRDPPRRCTTPLDFFHLLLPQSFLESMVDMTNEYAAQQRERDKENEAVAAAASAAVEPHSSAWEATTLAELNALLGCVIYMGIVSMDATRDYWSELTKQSFVADCFPRDRFLALLACLRVSEPAEGEEAGDNRLSKLRQLICTLEQNILRHFYPGRFVCVDDAMVAFKGRSIMRQHIAKKKSPTGFKVWMLVDCATNYVCALDVFTGMKGRKREEGAAGKVVTTLLGRLQRDRFHVVAMDGYFSSVQLFEQLLSLGFYAVGTTRHNRRHFPKELLREVEDKRRGEWVWRQKRGSPLVATSWMDKKPVNLLSTCADAKKSSTVQRRTGSELQEVACPEVLPLYLRYMRGVDVFAQRQSYSKIGRRSRKWFYSLVWFLVDVAIHNAYILYQQRHKQQSYDEKAFRKELMRLLVAGFSARKGAGARRPAPKRARDSLHTLEHADRQGACWQCRRRVGDGGHNARSRWRCADCNVFCCMPDCYSGAQK
jgi:hypothetical protein